jgi:hypothetical protein
LTISTTATGTSDSPTTSAQSRELQRHRSQHPLQQRQVDRRDLQGDAQQHGAPQPAVAKRGRENTLSRLDAR